MNRTLRRFDEDRRAFAAVGGSLTVEATERAWMRCAVLLVAEPATNAHEARVRAEYLLASIEGWALLSPRASTHVPSIIMITAAIRRDETIWGFSTSSVGHVN